MDPKAPLARYVQVDTSPARVAQIWQHVAARLGQRPARRSRWNPWTFRALAVGMALAGAAVVSWRALDTRAPVASALQNAALSTAGDALVLDLEDGSQIELGAHTRLEVAESSPKAVELRLSQGRVSCDVNPGDGRRRFAVMAAGVEVRVTGTRFSVELDSDEDRVSVHVERGSVEVRAPDGSNSFRKLRAGERWSVAVGPRTAAIEEPVVPLSLSAEVPTQAELLPLANSLGPSSASSAPASDTRAQGATVEPGSALELLETGNSARRAGDVAGAASAYERLLSRYPNDPRAGLAAFELGRLRMDRLNNLPGAVQALQRATLLTKDAGFREDAMARLVRAYAQMGDVERCLKAKASYLKSYPSGVHSASIAKQCKERAPVDDL